MSGMNYFDHDHVMYEVQRIAINHPGHEVRINFVTGTVEPEGIPVRPRLRKSIDHYMERLPEHLSSHNVDGACLEDVVLHHVATNRGHQTYMNARDDRGVEHVVFVNPAYTAEFQIRRG